MSEQPSEKPASKPFSNPAPVPRPTDTRVKMVSIEYSRKNQAGVVERKVRSLSGATVGHKIEQQGDVMVLSIWAKTPTTNETFLVFSPIEPEIYISA